MVVKIRGNSTFAVVTKSMKVNNYQGNAITPFPG
jgi:hypothetical protein